MLAREPGDWKLFDSKLIFALAKFDFRLTLARPYDSRLIIAISHKALCMICIVPYYSYFWSTCSGKPGSVARLKLGAFSILSIPELHRFGNPPDNSLLQELLGTVTMTQLEPIDQLSIINSKSKPDLAHSTKRCTLSSYDRQLERAISPTSTFLNSEKSHSGENKANETGTFKVGAISKAQKALNTCFWKKTWKFWIFFSENVDSAKNVKEGTVRALLTYILLQNIKKLDRGTLLRH